MKSELNSAVTDLLNRQRITFDVIEIPLSEDKKPIHSLEALLINNGLEPKSVIRSVLFRGGSEKFYMLAIAGGGHANWGVLRKHLGERKLRMAKFDEVLEATGYAVGAVPPVALPNNIPVLLDNSVNDYKTVIIGSGVLGYALALKSSDLLTLLVNAELGQFVNK